MRQQGFTVIEVIISTTFLSVLIIFLTVSFIQINKSYNRGILIRETQNGARDIVEELTNVIRNSSASTFEAFGSNVCIGGTRFQFNEPLTSNPDDGFTNNQIDRRPASGGPYWFSIAKTTDTNGVCGDPLVTPATSGITRLLLPDDLVVQYMNVERINNTKSFKIDVVVSTDARTNPDDFSQNGIDAKCDTAKSQDFCAVARVKTVVTARQR